MPEPAPVSQSAQPSSNTTNASLSPLSLDPPARNIVANSNPAAEIRRSSIPSYEHHHQQHHLAPPDFISIATATATTTRRASFNVFTTASFLSPPSTQNQRPPRPRHNTRLSLPRMMTTMNMASRLAGGRVKDQTIHHSFSDRSSTHTKPAPSQDTKGTRMGGYSADGLKRISNGIGREWSEKVAPCVSLGVWLS
jgi:hypothetical protein